MCHGGWRIERQIEILIVSECLFYLKVQGTLQARDLWTLAADGALQARDLSRKGSELSCHRIDAGAQRGNCCVCCLQPWLNGISRAYLIRNVQIKARDHSLERRHPRAQGGGLFIQGCDWGGFTSNRWARSLVVVNESAGQESGNYDWREKRELRGRSTRGQRRRFFNSRDLSNVHPWAS